MKEIVGLEVKLAKVETKVDMVLARFDKLENGVYHNIEDLQKEKADKKDFLILRDIVDALVIGRSNQNVTMGIGIALLTLLAGLLFYHIFGMKI